MNTFKELGLSDQVLKALEDLGFETPSEIQQQSIPQLLSDDKDFIGLAQTGTGKTAAFGLPLLEQIDTNIKATQALVLAPTRELGQQIAQQLVAFSKYQKNINVLAVYGGAAIYNQIKALKKATQHVIIATPGRLLDLINRKTIKLDQVKYVVLDEADEMLNMGFKEDLDTILSFTPEEKSTWLFSATMAKEIKKIVKKYMSDPFEVRINATNKVNVNIEHQFVAVKQSNKSEALTRFLDMNPDMRGLIFCRTKRDTQGLAEELLHKNYQADALHGDLSQAQRDRVMKRFKSHKIQVLVATDVAARGIDVNDLTHVFHYNLPDDIEYYTHRSGRTARAGKKGLSIVIINGNEGYRIKSLENKLDIQFEHIQVPETADIADTRIQNWSEEILKQDTSRLNGELKNKVNNLFGNLTKEELIAKILTAQLDLFNLGSSRDINVTLSERARGGSGRGRDRDRGRSKKWKGSRDRGQRRSDDKPGRKSSRNGRSAKNKYGSDRSERSESKYGRERTESKFGGEKSGRSSFSKRRSKRASEKSHLKSNGGKATFKLKSKRRTGK